MTIGAKRVGNPKFKAKRGQFELQEKIILQILSRADLKAFKTQSEAAEYGRSLGMEFFLIEDLQFAEEGLDNLNGWWWMDHLAPGKDWKERWFVTESPETMGLFLLLNKGFNLLRAFNLEVKIHHMER